MRGGIRRGALLVSGSVATLAFCVLAWMLAFHDAPVSEWPRLDRDHDDLESATSDSPPSGHVVRPARFPSAPFEDREDVPVLDPAEDGVVVRVVREGTNAP